MGTEFLDELEPRNGSNLPPALPPPLPSDASLEDVVEAVNALTEALLAYTKETRTHAVELGGIRSAYQEHGTRIETFCLRVEAALAGARNRATDPAPKGDAA